MKRIALQAGHQNITSNCDSSLQSGTGAPGEKDLTVRIRDGLSKLLISKGFQLFLFDANYNCDPKAPTTDYDLFLALHGDANVYGTGGGCISAPDPSQDAANTESKRIASAIELEYFKNSGIADHPERINNNMTFYYMWKFLSPNTPCVLLEMGVVQDAHDSVILADTNIVCNAIGRGICKAFGVSFDSGTPTPPMPVDPCATQNTQIKELSDKNAQLQFQITTLLNDNKKLSDKISKAKADLI